MFEISVKMAGTARAMTIRRERTMARFTVTRSTIQAKRHLLEEEVYIKYNNNNNCYMAVVSPPTQTIVETLSECCNESVETIRSSVLLHSIQILIFQFCFLQGLPESRLWSDKRPSMTITRTLAPMGTAPTRESSRWAQRIQRLRLIFGITSSTIQIKVISTQMKGIITFFFARQNLLISLSQIHRYGPDDEDRQWDSGGKWCSGSNTFYENRRNRKTLPQRPASSIGIHRTDYKQIVKQRSYDSEELDYGLA